MKCFLVWVDVVSVFEMFALSRPSFGDAAERDSMCFLFLVAVARCCFFVRVSFDIYLNCYLYCLWWMFFRAQLFVWPTLGGGFACCAGIRSIEAM